MDELKKVLEQVSNPADVAVVLLAGAAGFLIDAGFNTIAFLPPGQVGIVFASGALGLKKIIEAALTGRRARKELRDEVERVKALARLFNQYPRYRALAEKTERELALFHGRIISVSELRAEIDKIIADYRKLSEQPGGNGQAVASAEKPPVRIVYGDDDI